MEQEIERKFKVKNYDYRKNASPTIYKQGYLCIDADRTVRVRIAGEKGYITIKGKSSGCSRSEYEYPIPREEALELLENLCHKPLIEKVRYRYTEQDGKTWEIDEFSGDNEGLIVAEIELNDENESFVLPEWVGEEVTGDLRYYNSRLTLHPYREWK